MEAIVDDEVASPGMGARKPRSLRSRLFSNAVWSIGGRLLSMGSVFATNVLLARHLSTAEFSAYVVAAATAMLLAMPAAFGAPRVVLRLVREGLATNQSSIAARSAWLCVQLVATTSAVLAILFIAGASFVGDAAKWQAIRDYSFLVAAWFGLSATCLAISHALQGFDDFRAAALTGAKNGGILPNVLSITAIIVAVMTGHLTLLLAISVQVVVQLISLAYACAVLWRTTRSHRAPARARETPVTENRGARWLFSESWPILIIQLTSLGVAHFDLLLVGWMTGDREIAAYAAAARLCEILGSAQILAVAVSAPFISELYVTKELAKLEFMLRGIASVTAVPTLVMAALLLIAPAEALTFTYGPDFAIGAAALRAGVVGCVIAVLSGVNSLVMVMTGQQRELLRASVTTGILYLLVAPPLIAAWGITGAAVATTIVFGGYNIFITWMIKSRMGIWTTASLSPSANIFALRQLLTIKERAPRVGGQA